MLLANDRCNQENLIAQLKNGVQALAMPVDNLVSNWAYMVMASLAWTLKAWFALLLPETGRWAEQAHGREAVGAEDGVQAVRERVHAAAVPDRADGPADRVPAAGLEPVAGRVPAGGGRPAAPAAMLSGDA